MVQLEATRGRQDALITISPKDKDGNPAPIEPGTLNGVIESGDGSVSVESDSTVRVVTGSAGVITGRIIADADLGEGVQNIEDTFEITVIDPMAESLDATGEAVDKIA